MTNQKEKTKLIIAIVIPSILLVLAGLITMIILLIPKHIKSKHLSLKTDIAILEENDKAPYNFNLKIYTTNKDDHIFKKESIETSHILADGFESKVEINDIKKTTESIVNDETYHLMVFTIIMQNHPQNIKLDPCFFQITLKNNKKYKFGIGRLSAMKSRKTRTNTEYFMLENPDYEYKTGNNSIPYRPTKIILTTSKSTNNPVNFDYEIVNIFYSNFNNLKFQKTTKDSKNILIIDIPDENFILEKLPLVIEIRKSDMQIEYIEFPNHTQIHSSTHYEQINARGDLASEPIITNK